MPSPSPCQTGNALFLLLAGLLLFAITLVAVYSLGSTQGKQKEQQRTQKEAERINAEHEKLLQQERQKSQQATQRLERDIEALQTQLQEEQNHAQKQFANYERRLRAGTVRVSVPIVAGSAHCDGAATADPASGDSATHAQLEPAAAADLAAIAHDGDAAIRDLNACIAQYNTVRTRLNEWAQSLSTPHDVQAH